MKWRPEWEDLDNETFERINKLNRFDTLVVGWLQNPAERPALRDQMGDTFCKLHPDDRRIGERIFERASINSESDVREAYLDLAERFSEIANPDPEREEPAQAEGPEVPPQGQSGLDEALIEAARIDSTPKRPRVNWTEVKGKVMDLIQAEQDCSGWSDSHWARELGVTRQSLFSKAASEKASEVARVISAHRAANISSS